MTQDHPHFIFYQGIWLGAGTLLLSHVKEPLKFYTKWDVKSHSCEGCFFASQLVEIEGVQERLTNAWMFQITEAGYFSTILESAAVGTVMGKGRHTLDCIEWEFQPGSALQGFEKYERQDEHHYLFSGKYGSEEGYQNVIQGKIWLST